MGVLLLLLAGVDEGVVDGLDGVAVGLGTVPLAGVDAGVDSGVSGADGTGGPPACTTCVHNPKSYYTSLHKLVGILRIAPGLELQWAGQIDASQDNCRADSGVSQV